MLPEGLDVFPEDEPPDCPPLPEEEEAYMQAVQGRISYVLQINPQDEAFGAYRREWAAAMEAAAGKAGDTGTGEERA